MKVHKRVAGAGYGRGAKKLKARILAGAKIF
jgi:hypothetical protein